MLPLVSIVMPSLNQAAFIPAAVESVLSQSYPQIELIVADGGSTDATQAWLAQRQAQDARLRWFSEPDAGPADAVNKALRQAKGTLIGWLNSDDLYTPGAVQRAVQALQERSEPVANRRMNSPLQLAGGIGRMNSPLQHVPVGANSFAQMLNPSDCLMVYGQAEHIDAGGAVLGPYPTLAPPVPTPQFAQGCFICQPTVFFRRTLWLLLGPLDQSLKTAFDFDYWLRAFTRFADRIGFVDAVQAQSRLHADCITLRQRRTVALEGMQVLARHLGYAPKEWLLTYVNELLALPPGQRNVGDLKTHVDDTLALVKPWLQAEDFQALEVELGGLPLGE